tara:strand:+ start:16190 stop:17509 length:1320 start_codon:yes stop_codon:yes gene_type:complete
MQNFKFKSFLEKIFSDKHSFGEMSIIKYEEIIDYKIDSILNYKSKKKNTFYMKYPSGTKYFGYGKTILVDINKKSDIKFLKIDPGKILTNKNKSLKFFGGLSFDLTSQSYYPWKKIPKGRFIIPKILITRKSSKTIITYFKIINKKTRKSYILNDFLNEHRFINSTKHTKINSSTKINFEYESPGRSIYLQDIQKIIAKINNRDLSKVVISRMIKYSLEKDLDKEDLIKYLNKNHKNCFNFFINFNKNKSFMGSTPEKLIRLNKSNQLSIDAIAGSSKNKHDLKTIKEIDEHNYVIKHIKDIVNPICKIISIPKNPKILNLNYIYHLITSISGELKNKIHIIDLIDKLYPTPALLGYKSKEALKVINNTEKTDRGWYGGCIGFFDTDGCGDFFVPIRSFYLNKKDMFIFTGSGIVSKSDAKKEWEETKIKSKHILDYFK